MKKQLLLLSLLGMGTTSSAAVWINEIHYDNASTDVGEFVEVAANTDTDLTGWTVVLYNGNGGASYNTINLSGNLVSGNRTIAFLQSGIQNGAPDGMALVDDLGAVVEFICYEGSFAATNGPANGTTCTDIGVSETSGTAAGTSLQRSDDGSGAPVWQASMAETPNDLNVNQGMLPVELINFSVD